DFQIHHFQDIPSESSGCSGIPYQDIGLEKGTYFFDSAVAWRRHDFRRYSKKNCFMASIEKDEMTHLFQSRLSLRAEKVGVVHDRALRQ
ncbi:hypothetical protein HAX54_049934, partial [Datura stramonium]|nr:hypothetical protein [Datura stramonium]